MASAQRYHLTPRPALTPEQQATTAGRLVLAASIAMRMLQLSKVRRWHDLGRDLSGARQDVMLEPDQAAALTEFDELLHLLYNPVRDEDPPAVFLQVCLSCGAWSLLSVPKGKSGSSSKKCNLTQHCPGPTTKASAAQARAAIALVKEKKPAA
ncbi:hypothetical protein CHO01_31640 [Cellulomonas hominis]|uniref:Uncharacterized protein n=1 Tax=Cellulomonas hominis TaxID=156981 RepID=A0A511FJN1_9CELL|nr:hypothetical protein [Cellulomonas hominis]MBB5474776.1 hypothetical protein [Cellulomonas hominis]NKY05431.1 hypothetical protein [Cellulomonas hominis]GEL48048.1 hypothetical protein CHO01_31640 [Cellulomonas hominis]